MDEVYRLVLERTDEGDAVAHVYAADAGSYSRALAVAAVQERQEVPRTPFGDVVKATGPVEPGARPQFVFADGTVLTPERPLGTPGPRIFAERGPGVILHPLVTGHLPSWRHAQAVGSVPVAGWEAYLRKQRRRGIGSVAAGAVLLGAAVVMAVIGGSGPPRVSATVALLIGAVASVRRASTALRALGAGRRAQHQEPTRMRMRLWWAVGSGAGPVAVASLAPLNPPSPAAGAIDVDVVNVPPDYRPEGWVEVEVHGDLTPDAAPLIRAGSVELWPASTVRSASERRRRARLRNRRSLQDGAR